MRVIHWIALILVIIGALNWGMVGFFKINVVSAIFQQDGWQRVIYALVGLAGLWCFSLFKYLASCDIDRRGKNK